MAPMQFYVATEYMLGDHSSEPFCQSGRVPVGTAMLNLAASSVGLAVVDAGTGNMDCLFHAVEAVADMQPHLFTDNGPGSQLFWHGLSPEIARKAFLRRLELLHMRQRAMQVLSCGESALQDMIKVSGPVVGHVPAHVAL